jgi:hypothetical protein
MVEIVKDKNNVSQNVDGCKRSLGKEGDETGAVSKGRGVRR